MIYIFSFYFEPTNLNIIILISFEGLANNKKLKIKEIHLLRNKTDINTFIKRENLELLDDNNELQRSNIQNLKDLINDHLSGGKVNLYQKVSELGIELDIQGKFPTSFSQKVVQNLINLKPGELTTYSEIGNKIGSKAYRAIGNVCKSNPIPLIVPCHRVLRKNGEIGGFMGKSENVWETNLKKQLLEIEGYKIGK